MRVIEDNALRDRTASEARDDVGGKIIDKLLGRLEAMNTAQTTTASDLTKISGDVSALTIKVTPLADTVEGYQAERKAFRTLVIRAGSAIVVAIVTAMTSILVENYVLHEQTAAATQQAAATMARTNKAVSSAQYQKIEADLEALKNGG